MDGVVEITTAPADVPPKGEQVNSLMNTDNSIITLSDDSDEEMCSIREDKSQTVDCDSVSPDPNVESSTAEDVDMVQIDKNFHMVSSQSSESLSFGELLIDINDRILHVKFTQFLKFLQGDSLEISFPYISDQCEEIFRRIVLDVSVLKSKCLDTCHRNICDKILVEIMNNQSKYLLRSDYRNMKIREAGTSKVLVIKKVFVKEKTDHTMLSLNQKELHTLSVINEKKTQNTKVSKNENETQNNTLLLTTLKELNTPLSVNEKESQNNNKMNHMHVDSKSQNTLSINEKESQNNNKMNPLHVDKKSQNITPINEKESQNNLISNEEKSMNPPLHGVKKSQKSFLEILENITLNTPSTPSCNEKKSLNSSSSTLNNSMESLVSEASSTGSFTKSQRSPSVDSVPLEFKSHCLRTTLAFVKHKSDTNFVRYEELTFDQAKYVYEMVNSVLNNDEFNILFGNKLLYTTLCETVQIYKSDYKFKLDIEEFNLDKSTLVLEKMLKVNPDMNPKIVNTKLPEFLHKTQTGKMSRRQLKRHQAATDLINRLPHKFVKDHLTNLVEFFSKKKIGALVL